MKNCPYCNANVEGLTHHCDCCGALLNANNDLFLWYVFVTAAAGDVPQHVKGIFKKMNDIAFKHKEAIPHIKFNFFCYPDEMLHSLGIKESVYCFHKENRVNIKVVIDYEQYVNSTQSEKKCMIRNEIKKTILRLRYRFKESHPCLENFWDDIEIVIGQGTEVCPD